jgi:hypothetical protein
MSGTHTYDQRDVDLPVAEPGIDTLSAATLRSLDEALACRNLPARTHWQLAYSEAPAWESPNGSCGELEVWTMLPRDGRSRRARPSR